MCEQNNKQLEFQLQNLLQLRNNCLGSISLVLTGTLGLLFLEFSYLKLILFILGCVCSSFLIILTGVIDKDIDEKIKRLK